MESANKKALAYVITMEVTQMKFRPLQDRILVERVESEEKTSGGIILPDSAKEKPQQGKVVSVGPGKRDETGKLIPPEIKAGDRILFGKYTGTEIKIDAIEYIIMREEEVFGLIED
jgi:chaperonin GroES